MVLALREQTFVKNADQFTGHGFTLFVVEDPAVRVEDEQFHTAYAAMVLDPQLDQA